MRSCLISHPEQDSIPASKGSSLSINGSTNEGEIFFAEDASRALAPISSCLSNRGEQLGTGSSERLYQKRKGTKALRGVFLVLTKVCEPGLRICIHVSKELP